MANPWQLLPVALLVIALGMAESRAASIYETDRYQAEWTRNVPNHLRTKAEIDGWLESLPPPALSDAEPGLTNEILYYFSLAHPSSVKIVIVGPPRITGVAWPKFYIWLVVKSSEDSVLHEGAARLVIYNDDVDSPKITDYFSKRKLLGTPSLLESTFASDARIFIRKYLK